MLGADAITFEDVIGCFFLVLLKTFDTIHFVYIEKVLPKGL
jgi:hypothetical protein